MARLPIAICPKDIPPLPTEPHPHPSPLQQLVGHTVSKTDYDAVCVPLANALWQDRWERLCLRPVGMEDEDDNGSMQDRAGDVDRDADLFRREPSLFRHECNITRLEESQSVIALASDWLELDSPDEGIRFDSELGLRAEMQHALYLSLPVLVVPAPNLANRDFLPSYARVISNLLQMGGSSAYTQVSIRIPVSDPLEIIGQGPAPTNGHGERHHRRSLSLSSRPSSIHQHQMSIGQLSAITGEGNDANGSTPASRVVSQASSNVPQRTVTHSAIQGDPSSTWEMWDCIRSLCGYHPRLSVMLDLSNPLPPSQGAIARWAAEPVKRIWLPAGSFIPNAKGYPVLSKATQAFLRGLSKHQPTFVLSGTTDARHPSGGQNAYLQYLRHITSQAGASAYISPQGPAEIAGGYGDYLQAPLQPLADDLGSATYDVFESDPVKYHQYEEAVFQCVMDEERQPPDGEPFVIVVAGAGRGPLVAATLRALDRAERDARLYAVEKNAAAFTTLQERKALEWGDAVEILFGDMRTLHVPELADILVSELLGSFGDNELSPECIDGATRFLKPGAVSIPTSYTAHLAPIASSKLHHDVTSRSANAAEIPYVVMMQQANILSGETPGMSGRCGERIQHCWQWEHPRWDLMLDEAGLPLTNSHNTRSTTCTFHIPHASPCHGFAGYFEAHLYGNVGLSIHPDTIARVSPDLFSWFPIFFPLKSPLYLPSGAELEVNIWRLTDQKSKKVWYEWSAEAYLPTVPQFGGTPSGSMHMGMRYGSGHTNPTSPTESHYPPRTPLRDGQELGRVKIGQTELHNSGGKHYSIGL
ncbi:hypothetical protein CspHIS471_0505010 [Cutaneotrichosporon sp. HIS471]|nr:hypothetical protein CspHIS471_0505010 [Cutaneotrichosporon sp. HIS471]